MLILIFLQYVILPFPASESKTLLVTVMQKAILCDATLMTCGGRYPNTTAFKKLYNSSFIHFKDCLLKVQSLTCIVCCSPKGAHLFLVSFFAFFSLLSFKLKFCLT